MRIQVQVNNLTNIGADLKKVGLIGNGLAREVAQFAAEEVHELATSGILNSPASGRTYRRYNPSRIHQASAPGEFPASDLGRLVASITIERFKVNQYAYGRRVGSDLPYALMLEGGTSRMAPRPWLAPSVDEATIQINGWLAANVRVFK